MFGNDGKWSSTGGSGKSFRNDRLCITWYANKKSLLFQRELGDRLKDLAVKLCKSKAQLHEFEAKENTVVDRLLQEIGDFKMNTHQMSTVINGLREDMLMVTNYIESQCKSVKCDAPVQTDLYIGGENTDQTRMCEMDLADSQIAIDLKERS